MRSVELVVANPSGLHTRPATLFTEAAAKYGSTITVENLTNGKGPVDAKSILLLLTAGVSSGHRIRISATGADEDAAVDSLVGLRGGDPPHRQGRLALARVGNRLIRVFRMGI